MALHGTTAENPALYASLAQMLDEHKTTFFFAELRSACRPFANSDILPPFITMGADKRQCLQEVGALLKAFWRALILKTNESDRSLASGRSETS